MPMWVWASVLAAAAVVGVAAQRGGGAPAGYSTPEP